MSSSLSLRCEAGSTRSYGVGSQGHSLGKPKALPQCSAISNDLLENTQSSSESYEYQISRFVDEPFQKGVSPFIYTRGLVGSSFIWENRSTFANQARGTDAFEPLPVSRTGTYSSVASDDSHCSVPRTHNIVKGPDKNRIGFYDGHETESDSDEDEVEDAFKALNTAIIQVLGPDRAVDLIPHLYQLPAPLRAVVFRFGTHNGYVEEDAGSVLGNESSNVNPIQGFAESGTSKRRRTKSDSGNRNSQADVAPKRNPRAKAYAKIQALKYACPFNIFDPKRYCLHNEIESTGSRYMPCMGPGFNPVRHLKEHFESCHRMPQCQRCWKIFDNLEALSYHTDEEDPRCKNQTHLLVEKKETITEVEWNKIQVALSQRRGRDVIRKSEQEKWFEVWDVLFPKSIHKDVARPTHPYYVNPQGGNPQIPIYPETERMIELWKQIWDRKVKSVKAENPDAEYNPSREDVEKMIREAVSLTKESSPNPLPGPDFMPNTASIESMIESQLPSYSENTQSGYQQTPPELFGVLSQPELDPSVLNNSAWSPQASFNDNLDGGSDLFGF